MNARTKEIDVGLLKPHPLNETIYNNKRYVEDNDLKKSIEMNGLLEPIVVDQNTYQIISGHRRFSCILQLKWKRVQVRFVDVEYDIIKLIHFNKHREKSVEEKRNEERELKSYLKRLPLTKRKSILNKIPLRQFVSNEVGLSFNSTSKLNYIEKHDSDLLKDIYLGKVSLTEGYKKVKSKVENSDYKVQYEILDVKGRIKKLSSEMTKQQWLNLLDEIYGE